MSGVALGEFIEGSSIQFTLRGRVTRFFDGSVQYVLASARNDTGGISALPANSYDLGSE